MKKNILITLLIAAVLIAAYTISNRYRHERNIAIAKAELVSEMRQSEREYNDSVILGLNSVQDSLILHYKSLLSVTHTLKQKYAHISAKYEIERNKVMELTGSESVNLFLDKTEQPEFPVLKYSDDQDSIYLIPLTSIEYANVAFVDLSEQIEVNVNLRKEVQTVYLSNQTLSKLVKSIDAENVLLQENNTKADLIIAEKDKQIKAENQKYKAQRVKTLVVGIAGAGLVVLSLIF